jgi:hypothetical protein
VLMRCLIRIGWVLLLTATGWLAHITMIQNISLHLRLGRLTYARVFEVLFCYVIVFELFTDPESLATPRILLFAALYIGSVICVSMNTVTAHQEKLSGWMSLDANPRRQVAFTVGDDPVHAVRVFSPLRAALGDATNLVAAP